MSRHILRLSPATRGKAHEGIDKAPDGWTLELREPKRTDDQNRALWSLLNQVQKQKPTDCGVKMSPEVWKARFMQALGHEMLFVPTLDGDGVFPMGQRSSELTKAEFSALIEFILAYCASKGLNVRHFDDEEA